jgi:protein tyrosine phosphatase
MMKMKPVVEEWSIVNILATRMARSMDLIEKTKDELEKACKESDQSFLRITDYQCQIQTGINFCDALKTSHLNRYRDVIPYHHSLVTLEHPIHYGAKHGPSNYINASWIRDLPMEDMVTGVSDSDSRGMTYIAAQGPIAETCESFWKMIVEKKVGTVVMLTKCFERNMLKCEEYFPPKVSQRKKFGTVNVETLDSSDWNGTIHRLISVSCQQNKDSKPVSWTVDHYQIESWPDHGVPDSPEILYSILGVLAELQNGPVVIHCSAGIGRSGVVIALDMMIRRLEGVSKLLRSKDISDTTAFELLNLEEVVKVMRQQRSCMVQNAKQFKFCFRVLLQVLVDAIEITDKKRISKS